MAKRKHIDVKGVFKTEAQLGNIEYKPSKTIAMDSSKVTKEQSENLDKIYRDGLSERLKRFTTAQVRIVGQGIGAPLVTFNGSQDKPAWFWNEEAISTFPIWTLRDVVVLLENAAEKKTS